MIDDHYKDANDGLGDGPSVADILIGGMRSLSNKMDILMMSDATNKQAFSDLQKDYLETKKIVAEHQTIKNRAGGILIVASMAFGFLGVVFWKVVDIILNSKGINTGSN